MHRRVVEPTGGRQTRSPIIGERVVQFRARIHHEWFVLSGWFANRAPLEQENLDAAASRHRERPRRRSSKSGGSALSYSIRPSEFEQVIREIVAVMWLRT